MGWGDNADNDRSTDVVGFCNYHEQCLFRVSVCNSMQGVGANEGCHIILRSIIYFARWNPGTSLKCSGGRCSDGTTGRLTTTDHDTVPWLCQYCTAVFPILG